jgi:hypothetical protein
MMIETERQNNLTSWLYIHHPSKFGSYLLPLGEGWMRDDKNRILKGDEYIQSKI